MLASLFTGPIISALANTIFGKLESAWEAYVKKEISKDQLMAQLQQALISGLVEIEKAYADSLNKTFDSFMKAAAQSKVMQYVWASVAVSQLAVLLWHQVGIPAVVYFLSVKYPSSGATVDWAYALVMFCLGGGAIAMRAGPGSSSIKDQLKSLVAK